MNYEFIEIGACNNDTLIETANDTTVGITIEPIKEYLDQLPNKPNVKKLPVIISLSDHDKFSEIYYVPQHIIQTRQLPGWLVGCNSVGQYHFQHTQLKIEHLVCKQTVEAITIVELFSRYNVDSVNFLKIDTEGMDCYILDQLAIFLKEQPNMQMYPKTIKFETNELTSRDKITETVQTFRQLGYKDNIGYDTYLTLQ